MRLPLSFNPVYDPNYARISEEAHQRTRKVILTKAKPTMLEQDAYQALYTQNYKNVKKEMKQ